MKESIYDYIKRIKTGSGVVIGYRVIKHKSYFSKRYKKRVEINVGDDPYDGATGAKDINGFGWLFHDVLKRDKKFSDGSRCSNWQESCVLHDIHKSEGRWFRARSWFIGTLVWGSFVK